MASRTIVEYLTLLIPALADTASVEYQTYIDIAQRLIDPDYFGEDFNFAIALRMCHEYTLDNDPARAAGDGGFITDKTEGRVSVRFLHNMDRSSASTLLYTKYGMRLKALYRIHGPGIHTSATLGE
jgi:hypothetical protein